MSNQEPPPSYEDAQRINPGGTTAPLPSPRRQMGPRPPLPPPPPLDLPSLNKLRGKRIVLASKSPRRRQLLSQLGLTNIEIVPSTFAENLDHSLGALDYVLETARSKALDVYQREINNTEKGEPAIVIAADTIIISHMGEILEKPRDPGHHLQMLKKLRDEVEHKVTTAMAVMTPLESAIDPGYRIQVAVEETTVKFDKEVTDDLLAAYIKTRDGNDKAGGYGIQSGGSILIERIEGAYDNVVGLPLRTLLKLIEKVMEPEDEMNDDMDNMFGGDDDDDED